MATQYVDFGKTVCSSMDDISRTLRESGGGLTPKTLRTWMLASAKSAIVPATEERRDFRAAVYFGSKHFCPQWFDVMSEVFPEFS